MLAYTQGTSYMKSKRLINIFFFYSLKKRKIKMGTFAGAKLSFG